MPSRIISGTVNYYYYSFPPFFFFVGWRGMYISAWWRFPKILSPLCHRVARFPLNEWRYAVLPHPGHADYQKTFGGGRGYLEDRGHKRWLSFVGHGLWQRSSCRNFIQGVKSPYEPGLYCGEWFSTASRRPFLVESRPYGIRAWDLMSYWTWG